MTSPRLKQAHGELAELLTGITRHRVLVSPQGFVKGPYPWSIVCKDSPSASMATVAGSWWPEAIEQARSTSLLPLLIYRTDRRPWRALWPAGVHMGQDSNALCLTFDDCLESDPATWWRMVRRLPAK